MKPNDWQDTVAMAASAIEDLLGTADEHAGCWADVPARLRALTAPPAPANAADWGINMQTGTPILVYKNCSVIESEQALHVLSLINSAATPAPAVPEAIITAPIEAMRCGPAASYVLGWNSCRAAMLAAAPEGGNDHDTRR